VPRNYFTFVGLPLVGSPEYFRMLDRIRRYGLNITQGLEMAEWNRQWGIHDP